MYLSPRSPIFRNWPIAHGPGIHADEADSALPDVADLLDPRVERTLVHDAAEGSVGVYQIGESRVRSNPQPPPTVTRQDLLPLAMLVTGMWGKEPIVEDRRRRVSLPVVRQNPAPTHVETRDRAPMFDRLARLFARLEAVHAQADSRYAARHVSPAKRPWVSEMAKLARAVKFIGTEFERAASDPRHTPSILDQSGLPFGMRWGVVAGKGNKKLPFAAYSELPMATCPGAGACAVSLTPGGKAGYCYSFKAFRYPSAFSRQFLNTLANWSDREFAIMIAARKARVAVPDEKDYTKRVQFAIAGSQAGGRIWPQFVKNLVLDVVRPAIEMGKPTFLRLFVDGDVATEDCLLEWMQVCRDVGPGGRDIGSHKAHLEVYGYSKCWEQFVSVDHALRSDAERRSGKRGNWPSNYTLNLSTDSIYASPNYADVRAAVEQLPVTRGYFEGVKLHDYVKQLDAVYALGGGTVVLKLPPVSQMPFKFDEKRMHAFLAFNRVGQPGQTVAQAIDFAKRAYPDITWSPKGPPKDVIGVRRVVLRRFLADLLSQKEFAATIRRELIKDRAAGGGSMGGDDEPDTNATEVNYLDHQADVVQRKLDRLALDTAAGKDVAKRRKELQVYLDGIAEGRPLKEVVEQNAFTQKALHDKALAMAMHELFFSLGLGGSCPLVCSNCSDVLDGSDDGVHRCASHGSFKGRTIHIGIH